MPRHKAGGTLTATALSVGTGVDMGSAKLIVAGGIVAVVAAVALLVPSLAFGQPVAAVLPGSVAVQDAGDPGGGDGKAWGHHKDSPDFPGQGRGLDKDSPDFPGQGRGLDKDSPDFPGQGRGLDKDKSKGNPHDEPDD